MSSDSITIEPIFRARCSDNENHSKKSKGKMGENHFKKSKGKMSENHFKKSKWKMGVDRNL